MKLLGGTFSIAMKTMSQLIAKSILGCILNVNAFYVNLNVTCQIIKFIATISSAIR